MTVNNISFPWQKEITMSTIIKNALLHPKLIYLNQSEHMYILNGRLVQKDDLEKTIINEDDRILILEMAAGG